MTDPVLIVGGYGIVGMQLAEIIRQEQPELGIILAGRSLDSANRAAEGFGNTTGAAVDMAHADPLTSLKQPVSAVIAVANDPHDNLLQAAIKRALPYIDITRWTERLNAAIHKTSVLELTAPVSLASSWMAGVSTIVTKALVAKLASVDTIDTSILFRLADKAGPNSIEYADRLSIPFRVWKNNKWKKAAPFSDPAVVQFPSGYEGKAYRFDEPSQESLSVYFDAKSVSSRIGYDSPSTNGTMSFLVNSGLWKLISGNAFTKFRHSLLYSPGEGAAHEIVISVTGLGKDGDAISKRASILDPLGQTHLTALGAYAQLQETLGLSGRPARSPGIFLPENHADPDHFISLLGKHGVQIVMEQAGLI